MEHQEGKDQAAIELLREKISNDPKVCKAVESTLELTKRVVGAIQFVFGIIPIFVSVFVWIWGSADIASKIALSGFIIFFLAGIVYVVVRNYVFNETVNELVKNVYNNSTKKSSD